MLRAQTHTAAGSHFCVANAFCFLDVEFAFWDAEEWRRDGWQRDAELINKFKITRVAGARRRRTCWGCRSRRPCRISACEERQERPCPTEVYLGAPRRGSPDLWSSTCWRLSRPLFRNEFSRRFLHFRNRKLIVFSGCVLRCVLRLADEFSAQQNSNLFFFILYRKRASPKHNRLCRTPLPHCEAHRGTQNENQVKNTFSAVKSLFAFCFLANFHLISMMFCWFSIFYLFFSRSIILLRLSLHLISQ